MPFDPDEYLASKSSSSFDPDSYLASKGAPASTSLMDKLSNAYHSSLVQDFLHPDSNKPESTSVDSGALAQNLGYAGGLTGTGVMEAIHRATSDGKEGVGAEAWKNAARGQATPIPQGLQEMGMGPVASHVVGIPLQLASDPLTSTFSGARTPGVGAAAPAASVGGLRNTVANFIGRRADDLAATHLGQGVESDVGRAALDSGAIKFAGRASNTAQNIAKMATESAESEAPLAVPQESAAAASDGPGVLERQWGRRVSRTPEVSGAPVDPVDAAHLADAGYPQAQSPITSTTRTPGFLDQKWGKYAPKPEELESESAEGLSPDLQTALDASKKTANQAPSIADSVFNAGAALSAGKSLMSGNPLPLMGLGVKVAAKGRLASSAAVSLDALSNAIRSTPQSFGQFAPTLIQAASRGRDSLATAHYLLGQQYPAYRQIYGQVVNEDGDQGQQSSLAP